MSILTDGIVSTISASTSVSRAKLGTTSMCCGLSYKTVYRASSSSRNSENGINTSSFCCKTFSAFEIYMKIWRFSYRQQNKAWLNTYTHFLAGRDLLDYLLEFLYSILRLGDSRLSTMMLSLQQFLKPQPQDIRNFRSTAQLA